MDREKIDNIVVFNSEDTLFKILGTTKIKNNIPIDYKIMDNSNVIFKDKTSEFQHFSTYLIDCRTSQYNIMGKIFYSHMYMLF